MKFFVNELPYYNEDCPFEDKCCSSPENCPKNWNKYKVSGDNNPHECEHLIELKKQQ